ARKAQFTLTVLLVIPAGVVWGGIYLMAGAAQAAVWPLLYSACSAVNLVVLWRRHRFAFFQSAQLALIAALPFVLQLSLGGFVGGSAVVLWSLLAPLGA